MILTASDLTLVLAEITPTLLTGWIQKIQQPTDRTVVLEIRVPGQTHRLLMSCDPETARLHLTTRSLLNPPSPPPFCQFLRAHFQGARIEDIRQIPQDRIVEFQFTGKEGAQTIVCELTGHKANLLLLDADRRVLRDLVRHQGLQGTIYAIPHQRQPPHKPSPSRFVGATGGRFPVSEAIDAYYHGREAGHVLEQAKAARQRSLKKALRKEQRLIEAWRDDLTKAAAYQDYARYGELLKANLSATQPGADQITVVDYFDARLLEITIPLNPAKSAQSNMDDYFRKYRKHLAAERELTPRIERAEQNVQKLRHELTDIEQGHWTPPATPVHHLTDHSRTRANTNKRTKSEAQRRGPFRRFTSTDGLPIFVGRNARENDELTFGLAKSDDLWLHARGTPGSHVVVRLDKGADPPLETLRDATTLALLYSDLKKSGKGDVIYTRRKWVKKAKGQAPGAVIVTQEKSLRVNLDKARLDALKTRGASE